jgi:predicted metalloprotease with PDZ domain
MQLSYDRGHLMASIFDAQIRSASAQKLGLGDVLRAQRKAFAAKPALASDLFPVVLKKTVGLDASEDIRRYAVEGETVRFPRTPSANVRRSSRSAAPNSRAASTAKRRRPRAV